MVWLCSIPFEKEEIFICMNIFSFCVILILSYFVDQKADKMFVCFHSDVFHSYYWLIT